MRFHQPTIAYIDRRSQEGRTKKEILRCLKRHVIREIYQILVAQKNERIFACSLTTIGESRLSSSRSGAGCRPRCSTAAAGGPASNWPTLFEYFEIFYNRRRRHSTLGVLTTVINSPRVTVTMNRSRPLIAFPAS